MEKIGVATRCSVANPVEKGVKKSYCDVLDAGDDYIYVVTLGRRIRVVCLAVGIIPASRCRKADLRWDNDVRDHFKHISNNWSRQ